MKAQALKLAEDGSSDVILRLVEVYGSHRDVCLTSSRTLTGACLCSLMEELGETLKAEANRVVVPFSPNQIRSIRLRFSETAQINDY